MNLAKRLPATTDPCGEIGSYERSGGERNERQVVDRVDYQLSANHSLFGRYLATLRKQGLPRCRTDNILTMTDASVGLDNLAHVAAFGDTTCLGANTVNAFRVGV